MNLNTWLLGVLILEVWYIFRAPQGSSAIFWFVALVLLWGVGGFLAVIIAGLIRLATGKFMKGAKGLREVGTGGALPPPLGRIPWTKSGDVAPPTKAD